MKKMKKVLAVTIMLVMVMSLGACSKKTTKMPEEPKDILAAVQANTKDTKDVDASLKMDMKMEMMGEKLSITSDMDMLIKSEPYTAKIDTVTDMGDMGKQDMTMYMGKQDDKYYMYMNVQGAWTKQELEKDIFEKTASDYATNMDLDKYLKDTESFKKVGVEDVNGKSTVVLEGTISGKALEEIINETESLKNVTSMAGEEIDEELFSKLGNLTIKMWIDEKEVVPVKISMDMTDMMKGLFDSIMSATEDLSQDAEEMNFNVSECKMELIYNSFDEIKEIKIPEEALNATEAVSQQ